MPEGEGQGEAFCLLLWAANGGNIDGRGRPTRERDQYSRGNCTRPHDCYTCPLLQNELALHPPEEVFWACPQCIAEIAKEAKKQKMSLRLPGYYTEGQCQYKGCTRPARVEDGVELPPGFSRFLQVVLGPFNK
jgi:hypothetical protein